MRVGFLTLLMASAALGQGPRELIVLEQTVQNAIARAEPSIACIVVSRSDRYREFGAQPTAPSMGKLGDFYSRQHRNDAREKLAKQLDLSLLDHVPEAYGSGVVIDPNGLILTNYHVVRDATKIYVRLPGRVGSYADIHAADARADLAVLRLTDPMPNLPVIPIGDGSNLKKGSWVISLANPFSSGFRDGSPSASWGIVSNLRRRAPGETQEDQRTRNLQQYGTLIQTDARLNLGCSGGALLDMRGELIGLTTSLAALVGGETAGGYAVPMDAEYRKIIEVLRQGREVEYGFLGVSVTPQNPFDAGERRGVVLAGVTPGSPAGMAGLRANDIILSVNNRPIREYDDLFLTVGAALAGREVVLQVQSGGMTRKMKLTLAKFGHPLPAIVSDPGPNRFGLRVDYTSLLIDGNRQLPEMPIGVLVRDVQPGSVAEKKLKPLLEGNARLVITRVNGQPMPTPAEFYERTAQLKQMELTLIDPTRPEVPARTVTLFE